MTLLKWTLVELEATSVGTHFTAEGNTIYCRFEDESKDSAILV